MRNAARHTLFAAYPATAPRDSTGGPDRPVVSGSGQSKRDLSLGTTAHDIHPQHRHRRFQVLGAFALFVAVGAVVAQPVAGTPSCSIASACECQTPDPCHSASSSIMTGVVVEPADITSRSCPASALPEPVIPRLISHCRSLSAVHVGGAAQPCIVNRPKYAIASRQVDSVIRSARIDGGAMTIELSGSVSNVRSASATVCVACVRVTAD